MTKFKENFLCKTLKTTPDGKRPKIGTISYLKYVVLDNKDKPKENLTNIFNEEGSRWDNATMGLIMEQEIIQLEKFNVTSSISTEQEEDIKRDFGLDIKDQVKQALYSEIDIMENKAIVKLLMDITEETIFYDNPHSNKLIAFLHKIFGYKPRLSYSDEYNKYNEGKLNSRRFLSKILMLGNKIAIETRRGPGNFILVSQEIGSLIRDMSMFMFVPIVGSIEQVQYLGMLTSMKVYSTYLIPKNTVIVGRGNDKEDEPKIYQIDNEPVLSEIISPITMHKKLILLTKDLKTGILPDGKYNYARFQFNMDKIGFWKDLWCRIGFMKYPKDYLR